MSLQVVVSVILLSAGIIAGNPIPPAYVASFAPYPGYTGSLTVAGQVTISSSEDSEDNSGWYQTLTWSLRGLDTACVANAGDSVPNGCGIHIHTGMSCADAGSVGGHYYLSSLSSDPWSSVVYVASADGTSEENAGVQVVTGLSRGDIIGRVMVVHELASGNRIACAVIGSVTGAGIPVYVASFGAYPGYTGSLTVAGTMTIVGVSGDMNNWAHQKLTWSLSGLDTACVANAGDSVPNGCGIHVHTGTSCADAGNVGGHYYDSTMTSDPWSSIVYVASADGTSEENAGVQVVTGLTNGDITGRVMVVHELASGNRIACGVIGTTAPATTTATATTTTATNTTATTTATTITATITTATTTTIDPSADFGVGSRFPSLAIAGLTALVGVPWLS